MAIKDWKKYKELNIAWQNRKTKTVITIEPEFGGYAIRYPNYFIRDKKVYGKNLGFTQTKQQALKFAKAYMRKH